MIEFALSSFVGQDTSSTVDIGVMEDRNHIGDTVRLLRPKIVTNELGHSVWAGDILEADFELESGERSTDPYNSVPVHLF